jgi:hypothetical protein
VTAFRGVAIAQRVTCMGLDSPASFNIQVIPPAPDPTCYAQNRRDATLKLAMLSRLRGWIAEWRERHVSIEEALARARAGVSRPGEDLKSIRDPDRLKTGQIIRVTGMVLVVVPLIVLIPMEGFGTDESHELGSDMARDFGLRMVFDHPLLVGGLAAVALGLILVWVGGQFPD